MGSVLLIFILGYQEHLDYDVVQSLNPAFNRAVVRIDLFRDHRQTIQWVLPEDHAVLVQAELLVIDEAAAIPLPTVRKLLGKYTVFLASTVNGYEGTGRALSLKLIKQLREEAVGKGRKNDTVVREVKDGEVKGRGRSLREITLTEPIRYAAGDQIEAWLNKLLCLECCTPAIKSRMGCPDPNSCELYYVTRDTLFSFHPVSEAFLQSMMALYVASHYKNSPNDLQLLSDAPAHHLFVLLPPTDENTTTLPEPLCVIQVCMEGEIARGSALAALARGVRAAGDLIPWVVSQQFQEDEFASMSGARIVRIATHPEYVGMGYGGRAMEELEKYYSGDVVGVNEDEEKVVIVTEEEFEEGSLLTEKIGVRDASMMPPLLLRLSERPLKERLDWLGVSYGITQPLHKFWKRAGYTPVYVRQTCNELTGEHTCIMLKGVGSKIEKGWLDTFSLDFRKRFLELLSYQFRTFSPSLVLSVLDGNGKQAEMLKDASQVALYFSPFDLKRLESYSNNLLDYHVIVDLLHSISRLYFLESFDQLKLSAAQGAIFIAIGLQKKTVEQVEADLGISVSQILALFAKAVRKCSNYLDGLIEKAAIADVEEVVSTARKENPDLVEVGRDLNEDWEAAETTLEQDQELGASEAMKAFKEKQKEMIDSLDMST